jgi:hypothetical protein
MKKVQFEISNNKLFINVSAAPCEVTLVKVVPVNDEALRVTVEVNSRMRDDFMDWLVNNGYQFLLTGHSWTDETGRCHKRDQADAEEVYGWMRSTDIDFLDREHHSDAIVAGSFIDQVD